MEIRDKLTNFQQQLIEDVRVKQLNDGQWKFPCESGPLTDAYMIVLLKLIDTRHEHLIKQLVDRLLYTQANNGAWKLYEDEKDGNISATIEAYTALLFSRKIDEHDERLVKAKRFIYRNGGLKAAHVSTKFFLALNDLYPWPTIFPLPTWLLFMPSHIPISFHNMTSYVKIHFASVFILASKQFSIRTPNTPYIDDLIMESKVRKRLKKQRNGKKRRFHFSRINNAANLRAEKYILERLEADGTAGSYATATCMMIYSLLALGYRSDSPIIRHAIHGLQKLTVQINGKTHMENAESVVWDTSLLLYVLQESGFAIEDEHVKKGGEFILRQQQKTNENGAWGFSQNNSFYPDVDDTQACLRALQSLADKDSTYRECWYNGLKWLLNMQNKDGGWASFNKNRRNHFVKHLPIENISDTAIDISTADLTGRVVQFLGNNVKMTINHPKIKKAVQWLLKNQEKDGSWYGRWGVCYIYGTWAAVTGLLSVGVSENDPAIQKAKKWLLSIQNKDGGWGESCSSDVHKKYVPLSWSTPSQTAWALDTLIAICDEPNETIRRGIEHLMERKGNFTYPTGGGLPGNFYLTYHSYNSIWPLLAIAHFRKKYMK
ncbi:terpene cyclase/mutase family protein [Evansella cellulosilytica]|uniref:Squalene/oxidosqualene cyclase n=1 Tax=Evansella cellulosilytica (strain ATCC 21833 / DSM 2522 / FERM P-1141 / JCM 9156 / N-4) TaxID=649639 RepID=E6TY67_EVAC2|nr:prenyltransferase/squalene oxidase repeat-containing protein [Evansella cellulosilytica]ADU32386.1 squalene/oxidosqualene cyclase [Evansella cellulosilytica DSM 2522]